MSFEPKPGHVGHVQVSNQEHQFGIVWAWAEQIVLAQRFRETARERARERERDRTTDEAMRLAKECYSYS